MGFRLVVDDKRKFPTSGYECARDYDSAIFILKYLEFDFISLDYNLGSGQNTGYDILVWMNKNKVFPKCINIHSDNSYGVPKMIEYIKENFPKDTTITTNRL